MNAPLTLRTETLGDILDKALVLSNEKLRWAIYLRMINKPELIRAAIDGPDACWWKDDADDLADLENRAYQSLECAGLTEHRIATLRAALTALDGIRQTRLED